MSAEIDRMIAEERAAAERQTQAQNQKRFDEERKIENSQRLEESRIQLERAAKIRNHPQYGRIDVLPRHSQIEEILRKYWEFFIERAKSLPRVTGSKVENTLSNAFQKEISPIDIYEDNNQLFVDITIKLKKIESSLDSQLYLRVSIDEQGTERFSIMELKVGGHNNLAPMYSFNTMLDLVRYIAKRIAYKAPIYADSYQDNRSKDYFGFLD